PTVGHQLPPRLTGRASSRGLLPIPALLRDLRAGHRARGRDHGQLSPTHVVTVRAHAASAAPRQPGEAVMKPVLVGAGDSVPGSDGRGWATTRVTVSPGETRAPAPGSVSITVPA